MNIGVDLDDVLAELVGGVLNYHNILYNTSFSKDQIHSYNFWEVWGGTKEDAAEKLDDFYQTYIFKNISVVEGAEEGVRYLARKHKLFIITNRPNIIYNDTIEWIQKYFPGRFNGVYLTNHFGKTGDKITKAYICNGLGIEVIIDDFLDNAYECASNGIKVLLLDRPWNQSNNLPSGVTRVSSWKEVLTEIETFKS